MNTVDRFLYKLLIMTFLLFSIVLLDKINIVNYQKLQNNMSSHFNFLKLVNKLNGDTQLLFFDFEDVQSANANLIKTKSIKNGTRIILDSYEAVESLELGIVVKIEKNSVYLLSSDDYLYKYDKLDLIDVNLYQIIKKNQIIGKATRNNNGVNYYDVYITKDSQFVNLGL